MQDETTLAPFTEEIEVSGAQLVEQIGRLLAAGDVGRLQLRSEKGDLCLALPHAHGQIDPRWVGVVASLAKMLPRLTVRVARASHAPSVREAPEPARME